MKEDPRRRGGEIGPNLIPALRARIILAAMFVLVAAFAYEPIGRAIVRCVGGLTSILPISP